MNRLAAEPVSEFTDLHAVHKNYIEITEMQEMLVSAQLSLKIGSIVNFCDYEIIEFYETSNGTYTKLNYQDTIFIFIAESHRIY